MNFSLTYSFFFRVLRREKVKEAEPARVEEFLEASTRLRHTWDMRSSRPIPCNNRVYALKAGAS
jgi:hypothetical protein